MSQVSGQASRAADLLRGADAPPPEPRTLRAGPLTAELHGIELAYVRLGDREVVRRLYAAVRDENWDTLLPDLLDVAVEQRARGFTVRFGARHEHGAVAFAWQGLIEGRDDGTLTYSLDGCAERAFPYGRIGFCILHAPEEYAGRPFRTTSATTPTSGKLPVGIAPQLFRDGVYVPAVPPFTRIEVELDGGLDVAFDLEGDEFELEDQRNWTDASFKTYCTPLHLGFPHHARQGQAFRQRVTVAVRGNEAPAPRRRRSEVALEVAELLGHGLPSLGTAAPAAAGADVSVRTASLLRELGLSHVRAELRLDGNETEAELRRGAAMARAAGAGIEAALFASAASAPRAGRLLRGLPADVPLVRVSVFDSAAETTSAALADAVRASLAEAGVAAPVGGGTDLWFAEINRDPPGTGLDFLTYSITPQVHAFDDASLVETLPMQAVTVESARSLSGGLPIVVGPVTLRPREAAPDPRQSSLFGAAWTIGSLGQLALARPDAVTYYEALGPAGLANAEQGTGYPVYHALAEVRRLAGGELLRIDSTEPQLAAAVGAAVAGGLRLLVANLRLAPQRLRIGPLRGPGALVRTLDLDSLSAGGWSDALRTELSGGSLRLELPPYAVASIEVPA